MSWPIFQSACVAVLAFAYAWLVRASADRRRLLLEIALIFVAAWFAEETAIVRYRFYGYPDAWWAKVDEMPLLVAAIWPLVVLSSRGMIDVLFPRLTPAKKALAVGLAVVIDASLVESIAVAAGLWSWVEGGYLGVPLIGMLGWGCFAAAMTFALAHPRIPTWAAPLVAVGGTHALLVILWWAFFRHALRFELPRWTVALAFAGLLALALILRKRGRLLPLSLMVPRVAATSVFVVLLFLDGDAALVTHFAGVAVLYLALVDWGLRVRR